MKLRDLKQEITKKAIEGYRVKTNFSSCDFLVELGSIVISAKPICMEKEVRYEFILDSQWIPNNGINIKEIAMIKNVMDILEENRKLAISRLKKWTVEEYIEDKKESERRCEEMLEAIKAAFLEKSINSDY